MRLIILLILSTAFIAAEHKSVQSRPTHGHPAMQKGKPVETNSEPQSTAQKNLAEFKKLQKDLSSFDYLSVDFVNSREHTKRKRVVKTNGHAFFAKPSKFRWEKVIWRFIQLGHLILLI